jgi:hypothetical protein
MFWWHIFNLSIRESILKLSEITKLTLRARIAAHSIPPILRNIANSQSATTNSVTVTT